MSSFIKNNKKTANKQDEDKRKTKKINHVSAEAHHQGREPICWAYAIATAVRTVQRQLGCPEEDITKHSGIVHLLTIKYGKKGCPNIDKHIKKVLESACIVSYKSVIPFGTIKVKKVTEKKAKGLKDVVMVAGFSLYGSQWDKLQEFFANRPEDSLMNKKELGKASGTKSAHMVTIVGANMSETKKDDGYWLLKNSWGSTFADDGHFRVGFKLLKFSCIYALEPVVPTKKELGSSKAGARKAQLLQPTSTTATNVKTKREKKTRDSVDTAVLKPSRNEPTSTGTKVNKTKREKKPRDSVDTAVLKPSHKPKKKHYSLSSDISV